jgi:hypothetical protein
MFTKLRGPASVARSGGKNFAVERFCNRNENGCFLTE